MLNAITSGKRLAAWLAITVLAALLAYLAFLAYLSPELLLNFSQGFHC